MNKKLEIFQIQSCPDVKLFQTLLFDFLQAWHYRFSFGNPFRLLSFGY